MVQFPDELPRLVFPFRFSDDFTATYDDSRFSGFVEASLESLVPERSPSVVVALEIVCQIVMYVTSNHG